MKKLILIIFMFIGVSNAYSKGKKEAISIAVKLDINALVDKIDSYNYYQISSITDDYQWVIYVKTFTEAQTLLEIYCKRGFKGLRLKQKLPEITDAIDRENKKLKKKRLW